MSQQTQSKGKSMPRWDISRIPAGKWYGTKEIAAFLGINVAQVRNRCAVKPARRLPDGLVTQRVMETRGPIVLVKRLAAKTGS